jgi:hypothetical protein
MTREFEHYPGCRLRDPDNCSGCALTHGGEEGPNYAAWPLVYMENNRTIPAKWRKAFERELARTDNPAYVENLKRTMAKHGVRFSDAVGFKD